MAGKTKILAIKIVSDAKDASKGFDKAASGMSKFAAGMRKALPAALALTAAVGTLGKQVVDAASQLEQAVGATESVFGSAADSVMKFADGAADRVGLAKAEYLELASVGGAMLRNLGVPIDQLAGKTDTLISRGADLAATFGGTTKDAVEAMMAGMRGEYDPLEKFGVSIKKSDINARLAAKGLGNLTGAALKHAEQQEFFNMLMEQTNPMMGQFGRESDTVAGQQQRLAAKIQDTKAALGEALLPIMSKFAEILSKIVGFAQNNVGAFQALAGVIGGLAVAVIAINAAMSAYRAVVVVATAVQTVFNAVMALNPFVLVIVAVIALVAGIVLLYNKCEWFRNAVQAVGRFAAAAFGWVVDKVKVVWDWIKRVAVAIAQDLVSKFNLAKSVGTAVWNAIKKPIDVVKGAIEAVVNAVKSLINWIGNIKWPSPPGWMKSVGSFLGFGADAEFLFQPPQALRFIPDSYMRFAGAQPELTAAAPSLAPAMFGGGGGNRPVQVKNITYNINVDGAVDPIGVANTIRDTLNRTDVKVGNTGAVNWR